MGTNHSDFSGNAAAFSGVRRRETEDAAELTGQFTQAMNQTMGDIMPRWPSTMNAPMNVPGEPPPLSEADTALRFNVTVNGRICGPYNMAALAQMAAQGQINGQSMVWRPDMADPQAAETVPELAPLFAGAETPPPPASSAS
jgi:hypothetical protein